MDGLSSVLLLTVEGSENDGPGAVYNYSPYGEQSSETMEDSQAGELNAFGYTGAYQFLDGTVHLSHRFLDTFTLNFTRPDPSRQEMNNFTYAECDPINNTDPTGLMTACDAAGILPGTAGVGIAVSAFVTGGWVGAGCGVAWAGASFVTAVGCAVID